MTLDALFDEGDVLGVIVREIPVTVLNVSASGCLLESRVRIEPGATGALRVSLGDREYRDEIRIARCNVIEGSAAYRVGAEFLLARPPGAQSFRRVIGRLHLTMGA